MYELTAHGRIYRHDTLEEAKNFANDYFLETGYIIGIYSVCDGCDRPHDREA